MKLEPRAKTAALAAATLSALILAYTAVAQTQFGFNHLAVSRLEPFDLVPGIQGRVVKHSTELRTETSPSEWSDITGTTHVWVESDAALDEGENDCLQQEIPEVRALLSRPENAANFHSLFGDQTVQFDIRQNDLTELDRSFSDAVPSFATDNSDENAAPVVTLVYYSANHVCAIEYAFHAPDGLPAVASLQQDLDLMAAQPPVPAEETPSL